MIEDIETTVGVMGMLIFMALVFGIIALLFHVYSEWEYKRAQKQVKRR